AVRRVRHNGEIRWCNGTIYISGALTGEPIGLSENDDGSWTACYGPIVLGIIDHRGDRLRKPKHHACGLVGNASALPTGSTGSRTAATTDLNKTRNVLPMSPV